MDRHPLRLILPIGLAVRLAALLSILQVNGGPDAHWEYATIAQNLLGGRGFTYPLLGSTYRSVVAPVFPLLCATLHWIWGPGLGLFYAFQLAVSGLLIATVYSLAKSLLGPEAALWAAALTALEPGSILYQSYKVDVAALTMLLMTASAKEYVKARLDVSIARASVAGCLAGAAMLARPDALAVAALPAAWEWASEAPGRRRWRPLLGFGGAMIFTLTPWLSRNFLIHGRLMMTSGSGMVLWAGNNPRSTGTLWTVEGEPMFHTFPAELRSRLEGAGESANDSEFRATALKYIRDNPAAALFRWSRNLLMYFTYTPDYSDRYYYKWLPAGLSRIYQGIFMLVAAAALCGTRAAWKAGNRRASVLWGPPLLLALIHATHYVEGRHRLLALPFLLTTASALFARYPEGKPPTSIPT